MFFFLCLTREDAEEELEEEEGEEEEELMLDGVKQEGAGKRCHGEHDVDLGSHLYFRIRYLLYSCLCRFEV